MKRYAHYSDAVFRIGRRIRFLESDAVVGRPTRAQRQPWDMSLETDRLDDEFSLAHITVVKDLESVVF
jgi:hypothetical protein